jgi:hypothetical protein
MSSYTALETNDDTTESSTGSRLFTNLHGVIPRKTFTLYQHRCDNHKSRNIKRLLRCAAAFIFLKGQRFGLENHSRM